MDSTIELLLNRRTHRSFKDQPISKEHLKILKEATLRAPTAGNMLLYSVIEVKDQKKKELLAEYCDDQSFIAKAPLVWLFVSDARKWANYYKLSGSIEKGLKEGIEFRNLGAGDLLLANSDAIIAAQSSVVAAEALGIGSCYIGDILEEYEKVKELFELPKYVSVATLVVYGYPKSTAPLLEKSIRPPSESVFMEDRYFDFGLKELEIAYGKQEEKLRKQKRLPFENQGTISDYFYFRKHISEFMEEMNRSSKELIKDWIDLE